MQHPGMLQVRRDESIVEKLHGKEIADPYRWLDDPDSAETKACESPYGPPSSDRQGQPSSAVARNAAGRCSPASTRCKHLWEVLTRRVVSDAVVDA